MTRFTNRRPKEIASREHTMSNSSQPDSTSGELTPEMRAFALVITAIANGDLTRKVALDAQDGSALPGETRELALTLNAMDYQMNTLEQILFKEKARVLNAKSPLYEATEVIYEAIDRRIHELIEQTKYPCKYAILMGSILINSDSDMGSFISLKRFEIINLVTGERQDQIGYF